MCLFGTPIRDLIPILPGKYHPHSTWTDTLHQTEMALRHRHMTHQEKWSDHTGTVIEVRQFHQYLVRVDGSGRHTLRNRKFLRKYTPAHPSSPPRSILDDLAQLPFNPRLHYLSQSRSHPYHLTDPHHLLHRTPSYHQPPDSDPSSSPHPHLPSPCA